MGVRDCIPHSFSPFDKESSMTAIVDMLWLWCHRFCYVSGMDYECVCGRWDKAAGSTTAAGNGNSTTGGGHGRAVGPRSLLLGDGDGVGRGGGGGNPGGLAVVKAAAAAALAEGGAGAGPGMGVGVGAVSKVHPAARKPDSAGEFSHGRG